MSEINCYCDEYNYGTIFPNISISVYKNVINGYIADNGVELKENSIGLIILNDPFILINDPPINNKYYYYDDLKINNLSEKEIYELVRLLDKQNSWNELIKGYANDMYILVESIKKSGYKEGNIGCWINQKTAEFFEKSKHKEMYKRI